VCTKLIQGDSIIFLRPAFFTKSTIWLKLQIRKIVALDKILESLVILKSKKYSEIKFISIKFFYGKI
jgi:hypothetical protein